MGNKIRWKSVWSVAKIEYIKWITNPRIIILGVLLIFMKGLAIDPLIERGEKMNIPLNAFEPFVAIGNSGMLVMMLPCVFMVLLGDYPRMGSEILFTIHRAKKINWFLGQFIFLILAIGSYLTIVMISSIFMSRGRFSLNWSDVVTKYCSIHPEEAGNFTSQLLPSNLYNQIPLYKAVLVTFILFMAYLLLLALILYVFRMLNQGAFAMTLVFIVIGLGVVTCSLKKSIMWLFPMANTIVWLHYDVLLQNEIYPVWFSAIYYIICIFLIFIANLYVVYRKQFMGMEEA